MKDNTWNIYHNKAKNLELRLESKLQKYTSLAQKINADFLCYEESPLLDSNEENELASDIERDLNELSECIKSMQTCSTSTSLTGNHQDILIKRYQEILFDFNSEFKNTSATVQIKKESIQLFESHKNTSSSESGSSLSNLLNEKSSIVQSMKSINEVIQQAFEARSSLSSQRSSLTRAGGGLGSIIANVPSFNRLIDGVQKKKMRESVILACIIAFLVCFVIWYVILR